MNSPDPSSTTRFVVWLMVVASAPALAAAIISGVSYVEYFAHMGSKGLARFLAFCVAAAVGSGYMAIVHLLLKGAAKLPPNDRAKLTPVIFATWLLISLASAFPILINAGKGIAMNASSQSYISKVMTSSDRLKEAALAFDQIGPVLDNGIATLSSFRRMEIDGVYSGTKSEGRVARWIAGFNETLKEARSSLALASERTQEQFAQIDRAIDNMRRTLIDPELNLKQKQAALQKAGDETRSAMLTLKQTAPVASLKNITASLRSNQTPPKFSNNAKIRRGQEKGVRRIKTALRRIGRDLDRRVDTMAQALKIRIPAYSQPSDAILVLSYLYTVPHVAAMSFGLDSMPFAIYLIVARMYDAERARHGRTVASSTGWRIGETPSPNAPLGSHPHPNARRSRSNTRLNGDNDDSSEGSDQ